MSYDWTNKTLRAGAVNYALQRVGPMRRGWQADAAPIAQELGCDVSDLAEWVSSGEYAERGVDAVEFDDQTRTAIGCIEEMPELPSEESAILRKAVDYVCGGTVTTWEIATNSIRIPDGGSWRHVDVTPAVHGFPRAGRCGIEVIDGTGCIVAIRLYALMQRIEGADLYYRQLVPVVMRDCRVRLMRMAILESIIHPSREPSWGQAIADEFKVSEPAVHHQRVRLRELIRQATHGRAGLAGMLNKDQSNKGRARVGGMNPRANHDQP